MDPYNYRVSVLRVIDGDTVEVMIDLGFKLSKRESVRLEGIDTPELNSTDPETRGRAQVAKARLEKLLPEGSSAHLKSRKLDKYGRCLGDIWVLKDAEIVSVGMILLDEGLAVPYK